MLRSIRAIMTILTLATPACLSAQHARVDSLVESVKTHKLAMGSPDWEAAVGILSQRLTGYSENDRARLRNALLQPAYSDSFAALTAVRVLADAGGTWAPVPLATSFDDLRRLYRSAPGAAARVSALTLMYALPDRERVLQFWGTVVSDPQPRDRTSPVKAIVLLATHGGEAGRTILQKLYASKQVTNEDARWELEKLASWGFRYPK